MEERPPVLQWKVTLLLAAVVVAAVSLGSALQPTSRPHMNAFSGSAFDGSTHPTSLAAGDSAPPSVINHIRHEMGFDKPLYQQYWDLVWNLVRRGNFGYS